MASRWTRKIGLVAAFAAISMAGCAVGRSTRRRIRTFRRTSATPPLSGPLASRMRPIWLLVARFRRSDAERGRRPGALRKSRSATGCCTRPAGPSQRRPRQGRVAAERRTLILGRRRASIGADAVGRIEQALGVDRNGGLYAADIGASWDVDLFERLRRGHEASIADYQAADAAAAATRVSIVAETADAYILVRTLQARARRGQGPGGRAGEDAETGAA